MDRHSPKTLGPTPALKRAELPSRTELTPTWHILVPLVAVVVALVALAVVPPSLTRQNVELRHDLSEVLLPLSTLQTQFERSIASEAAAARGYALTGDPAFSDRFLSFNAYAEGLKAALDSLSRRTSEPVAAAVDSLIAERARWEMANFGLTPTGFRERLSEHQQRYEAIIGAAQDLDGVLDREVDALRQQIRAAEERRARVTVFLAVIALIAAAGALWLAHRLRRSNQHLLRLYAEVHTKERALAATAEELRTLNETLEARVEERTRQVRQLSHALTLAEQRERQRIAHVLHDDLQQLLFGAQMAGSLGDTEQLQAVLDEAMALTRSLSHELSPPLLQEDNLEDLLRWLAVRKRGQLGMEVEVEIRGSVTVPDMDLRVLLYQLLRELLFNVVKHAGTKRARLVAEQDDGHARIVVEDEGAGFDPAAPRENGPPGLGLPSVRERLELVGGRLEVASAPGEGTRVTITMPSSRNLPR